MIVNASFDGEAWRKFASNMVDLIGGEQDKDDRVSTPYIVDALYNRAIGFKRSKPFEAFRNETFLHIASEWMVLPEPERAAVQSRITEPYINESVSAGYTYPPYKA